MERLKRAGHWRACCGPPDRNATPSVCCGRRWLPCVCADNVGFAELITHGVDGFVFQADDDDAALAHLRTLRDDVELRRRMGRAARTRVEQVFGPGFAEAIRSAYLGPRPNVSFPPQ